MKLYMTQFNLKWDGDYGCQNKRMGFFLEITNHYTKRQKEFVKTMRAIWLLQNIVKSQQTAKYIQKE